MGLNRGGAANFQKSKKNENLLKMADKPPIWRI